MVSADIDRYPVNASGDWCIDRRCIDCGASPTVAPGLIVRRDGQSVFHHQPATEAETRTAWRALLVCPTASVRRVSGGSPPAGLYPEEIAQGVYRCGYKARSSYGAHSYLVMRPAGNALIDSPRWTRRVADFSAECGGLRHIFLTHRDDVADAQKYAQRFGAEVWIHERDADAAPYATQILSGVAVTEPVPGWQAIPLPGHTAGSTAYLLEGTYLFTGDSLASSPGQQRLTAFRDACWHSWSEQARSLGRLLNLNFEWVLAGHGGSARLPPERMRTELERLLRWMASAAYVAPVPTCTPVLAGRHARSLTT